MFPLPINIYFEFAAFLTSVIYWRKIKVSKLRWIAPYLFFIIVIEFTGRYITKELNYKNNGWLYNISVPIEYLYFGSLFYKYFTTKNYKVIAKWSLILFPIFVLFNIFFIQGIEKFNNNFLKVGSCLMIILCCLYFFDLLKIDKVISLVSMPMFWISSGLFIFNVGEFVYISLSSVLFEDWKNFRPLVKDINNNLIYILYSSFILGIITAKWDQEEKI